MYTAPSRSKIYPYILLNYIIFKLLINMYYLIIYKLICTFKLIYKTVKVIFILKKVYMTRKIDLDEKYIEKNWKITFFNKIYFILYIILYKTTYATPSRIKIYPYILLNCIIFKL